MPTALDVRPAGRSRRTDPAARVRTMSQVERAPANTAGLPPDDVVVSRLRAGDERMFAVVVDAWSPGMLRAARAFVADGHTA